MAGVTAAAALALAATLAAYHAGGQERKDQPGSRDAHHEMFQKCAEECADCQLACDACARHCAQLVADGKKEHLRTLQTCQDCADFCSAAAHIVARQGPFAALICESCAEACARCGKECERFPDDQMMRKCAEECRACEKACREMVRHAGPGGPKK
jgi:hypothetical protein